MATKDKLINLEDLKVLSDHVEGEVTDLKSDIGFVGKFIEDGQGTGYYKYFSALSANASYKIVVTAHTSGTYQLNFATAGDSSTIVDTISDLSLTANTPYVVRYTPSVGTITHARLWICDNWDVKIYASDNLWDEVESLSDAIEDVEALSSENKNVLDTAFTKEKNKNLLNKNEIIKNKYYDSSGNLLDLSGWDTSNAIPVEQGKTYYFSEENNGTRGASTMWFLILFSENNQVLDYNNTGLTSYTPQSNGTLYFTWRYSDTRSDLFFGEVSNPNYYDEFGFSYIAKKAESFTPYSGVVWACVGDSMTEHNSRAETHYYDYISQELGFKVLVYGVSGSGYAAQKDSNSAFYQRIANITDSFDVLTILGSVNDMAVINDVPLGTYEDADTTTIGGCINAAIDSFYTIAPFKKLGIISQPPSIGTANNGHLVGTTAQSYNDLLAQICANRSIPFLDLFNASGLRPWDSDFRTEFYNENGVQDTGVHPNSKGQKIIATKIREFLKTLI